MGQYQGGSAPAMAQQICDGFTLVSQVSLKRLSVDQMVKLEFELDKLLRILPARRNTPELMRRVRMLTEQGDFDLLRFTPRQYIDQDFYSEWPIDIQLDGGYHNLALLFDQISRFSRIINIENLRIDSLSGRSQDHSISAGFTAKTFVYKDEEEVSSDPIQ